SANAGGAVFVIDGTATLRNTILADSTGGDCFNVIGSVVTDDGHNIVEDNSCGFTGGADPMLGPLANNGGPTQTHALLPGSIAIDAVPLSSCAQLIDQRGVSRPQGVLCDVG